MWKKVSVFILLLCFFVLLQNSFFVHFSLFGSSLNLIFITFFLVVFFEGRSVVFSDLHARKLNHGFWVMVWAIVAGFLLDVSSYSYLGPSIVLLVIIGFSIKSAQSVLTHRADNYPFMYFLPLFFLFFIIYQVMLMIYLRFTDPLHPMIIFDLRFVVGIIYNSIMASAFFYVYKKCQKFIG